MQLKENLSHIDYLQVTDSNSHEMFCGSNQEWFSTERQRFVYFLPSSQENRIEKAKENHRSGYNCSQAVACAYCDKVGIEEPFMYQMMEGFGLGMGSMEGTCGHCPVRLRLPA